MVFFQTCMARVFSNHHNSHNKHIKLRKFGGKIVQLLCLDLYKYKISRQIDSSYTFLGKTSTTKSVPLIFCKHSLAKLWYVVL